MLLDVRLVRLTLRAAVAHARRLSGGDPRSDTIFFVRCVLVDLRKRRWYNQAYTISRLLTALEQYATVNDAIRVFGLTARDLVAEAPAGQTPASNTGVTPRTDQQSLALKELLNGKAD